MADDGVRKEANQQYSAAQPDGDGAQPDGEGAQASKDVTAKRVDTPKPTEESSNKVNDPLAQGAEHSPTETHPHECSVEPPPCVGICPGTIGVLESGAGASSSLEAFTIWDDAGDRGYSEVTCRIVAQNLSRFQMCLDHGPAKKAHSEIQVRFAIDSGGNVSAVDKEDSTLTDHESESCLVSAFYGLSFPMPPSDAVAVHARMRWSHSPSKSR